MSNGMIGMPVGNSRIGCFVQAVELAARNDSRYRQPAVRSRSRLMARVRSASQWAGMPVPAAVTALLMIGCIVGAALFATVAA
jgi:hypothetical protein